MADMQPPPSPVQIRSKKPVVLTGQPKFDLESYISNYKGRTRFERLLLIGKCSSVLGVDALKLAIREAKQGKDIKRYLDAQNQLEIAGPTEPEARRDLGWMERTDKSNHAETQRLEAELKQYKNNLIKESIRMGNEDLGKHYQAIGDLTKAFEAFSRMRQDISMPKHIVDVGRHLIEVALEQKNWLVVSAHVQKIKMGLGSGEEDKAIQPYLCAADGLALMDVRNYYGAANRFLATDAGMGQSCNTLIGPNDVAIYGCLCALATMDRNELQKRVLENSSFRTYLELEPHIRKAITFFVNSRYTACLNVLEAYHLDYFLDIHLHNHIEDIYQMVRSKSIVQYFIPFSCVTLDSLNQAFAAPGKNIDKELVGMIQRKELNARINTVDRLLEAVPPEPRAELQAAVLKTAQEYEREVRFRIINMNICSLEQDIKNPKRSAINEELYGPEGNGGGGRNMRSRDTGIHPGVF